MGYYSITPSSVIVSYVSLAFMLVILFLICQNNWDFAPVSISSSAMSHVFSPLISFSSCSFSTFCLLMYLTRIVVFLWVFTLDADQCFFTSFQSSGTQRTWLDHETQLTILDIFWCDIPTRCTCIFVQDNVTVGNLNNVKPEVFDNQLPTTIAQHCLFTPLSTRLYHELYM